MPPCNIEAIFSVTHHCFLPWWLIQSLAFRAQSIPLVLHRLHQLIDRFGDAWTVTMMVSICKMIAGLVTDVVVSISMILLAMLAERTPRELGCLCLDIQ